MLNSRHIAVSILALLCLNACPAHALTVSQTFRGEASPPAVANVWDYGPEFVYLPNGNLAMYFCSGYHFGLCTRPGSPPTTLDFTTDVVRMSERLNGVWQSPTVAICPSNFSEYVCPVGPCGSSNQPGSDMFHTCDPSAVYFNDLYYLYYTAPTDDVNLAGTAAAIFLAYSSDGFTYTKHTDSSGVVVPVIPFSGPDPLAYGIGQSSVLVDEINGQQTLVMYYTSSLSQTECSLNEVRRAESFDGVIWHNDVRVTDFCDKPMAGSVSVQKVLVNGSPFYFMVSGSLGWCHGSVVWNFSVDGVHFQPYSETRLIDSGGFKAHNPGLSPPNGASLTTVYGSASATTCENPATWSLRYTNLVLQPEVLYGSLDEVTATYGARGWVYDPDKGINDQATWGGSSAPAGFGSAVRAIATNMVTGEYREGGWQLAELPRCDLPIAGVAPDCYHGYSINLLSFLSAGTWRVRVQGGEYPIGGVGLLGGEILITIPPDAFPPSISQVFPNSGPNSGGTTVTISGTAFGATTAVAFGGLSATAVIADGPTSLRATTPAYASSGPVGVTVTNPGTASSTLAGGFNYTAQSANLRFFPVTPCRAVDTRLANGTFGGPAFTGGSSRSFDLRGLCGIPSQASAVELNFTVVGPGSQGAIRVEPGGVPPLSLDSVPFAAGVTRAQFLSVGLTGPSPGIFTVRSVLPTGSVHLVIDVFGYHAP